jgi:uncharacterized protein YxjI
MISFPVQYPLRLTFKFWVFAPQFSVEDSQGRLLAWATQKLFRLREAVTIFSDSSRKETIYSITADRIIDFGARYHFFDGQGKPLGAVQRFGMKSFWKVQYDVLDSTASVTSISEPANVILTIREDNPWIKVLDGVLEIIPVAGDLVSGLILHPSYSVSRPDGTVVLRVRKRPAFLESRFSVDRLAPLTEIDEQRALLSIIMLVVMERKRG